MDTFIEIATLIVLLVNTIALIMVTYQTIVAKQILAITKMKY